MNQITNRFRLSIVSGAFAVIIVVSFASAIVFLASDKWFGSSDLPAFVFWTILIAGMFALAIKFFTRISQHWNVAVQYLIGTVFGGLTGFAVTFLVASALGPMFFAFSFPVGFCWLLGSIAGTLFTVAFQHPTSWPAALLIFLIIGGLGLAQYSNGILTPVQTRQPRLSVYFKKSTTNNEINYFWDNVVKYQTGKGGVFLDGICGLAASYKEGYHTIEIDFWFNATEVQRETVIKAASSSPLVLKMVEIPRSDSDQVYACGGPLKSP